MIKIFKVEPMTYTPFSTEQAAEFLKSQGIVITNNPKEGDVFVSCYLRRLLPFRTIYPAKKYLLWTHEPRFNTNFTNKINGNLWLPDVHIMNAYTGDIYLNNYTRYGRVVNRRLELLNPTNFSGFKNKKIAALMLYRNNRRRWSLQREGQELDLCYLRTRIALEGYKLNKVDIYGEGWPDQISLEQSRGSGWRRRKLEILENYHFNLCFENTNIDYYCSEKIWDSINAGCLPIYYGKNNKIYEEFPKNSFIDYAELKTPAELFEYVEKIDDDEFCDRLNLCIETFNKIYEKRKLEKYYDKNFDRDLLQKIISKLEQIVD